MRRFSGPLIAACLAIAPAHAALIQLSEADFAAASLNVRAVTIPATGTPALGEFATAPTSFDGVTVGTNGGGATNYEFGAFGSLLSGNALAISGPENWFIDFDTPTKRFAYSVQQPGSNTGFGADSCNSTCVPSFFAVEAFRGGVSLGAIAVGPGFTVDERFFIGIASDSLFDRLEITETSGGIDNEFFGEFLLADPVPLPAGAPLFLTVLGGAAVVRARRRRG